MSDHPSIHRISDGRALIQARAYLFGPVGTPSRQRREFLGTGQVKRSAIYW